MNRPQSANELSERNNLWVTRLTIHYSLNDTFRTTYIRLILACHRQIASRVFRLCQCTLCQTVQTESGRFQGRPLSGTLPHSAVVGIKFIKTLR